MYSVNISVGTIKAVTIYANDSSCSLSHAYHNLINSSILLLISYKSAQASHRAKRHDSSSRDNWDRPRDITPSSGDNWDRPRDITPSSGDGLCPGRATGQETLLRHQETVCVQGEPQAKRHYSVIRRRPVSRESHRQYQWASRHWTEQFLNQGPLPILAIFHEQCNLANNEARHSPEWTFLQKTKWTFWTIVRQPSATGRIH